MRHPRVCIVKCFRSVERKGFFGFERLGLGFGISGLRFGVLRV